MTPEVLRKMQIDLTEASLEISKYYSISSKKKSFIPTDFNFDVIPCQKTTPKKTFLERTLSLFL